MRQAINENRTVQLVLLCLLALAAVFMVMRVKGGGSSSAAPPAADSSAAGSAAATPATDSSGTATAAPATTSAPATPGTTASPTGSGAPAVPANLVPGPGMPKSLFPAYRHGKAIVLLVRRAGGIDDQLVRGSVNGLNASSFASDIRIYVTKARQIARYAWLTQGVAVSELPALVVLRPRDLSHHGTATASVSYGFRDSASVLQAVRDALYRGPTDRPYHP